MEAATEEITSRKPVSVIKVGVPLIALHSEGFETEVLGKITKVTDSPEATYLGSCVWAMQKLEIKRPAMLTPFNPPGAPETHRVRGQRGAGNLRREVGAQRDAWRSATRFRGLHAGSCRRAPDRHAVGQGHSRRRRHLNHWRAHAERATFEGLEVATGLPVVDSMQVIDWQALRLAGVNDKIDALVVYCARSRCLGSSH